MYMLSYFPDAGLFSAFVLRKPGPRLTAEEQFKGGELARVRRKKIK